MKKLLGILLCVAMVFAMANFSLAEETLPSFLSIKVGEEYTDLTASIKYYTHRTDLTPVQNSTVFQDKYIAEFNKLYPNIKVEVEATTDYAQDALVRLTGSDDWGDIMPAGGLILYAGWVKPSYPVVFELNYEQGGV